MTLLNTLYYDYYFTYRKSPTLCEVSVFQHYLMLDACFHVAL